MRRKQGARSVGSGSEMKAFGGGNSHAIDVATTLNARGSVGRMDFESETFVTHTLRGEDTDLSSDIVAFDTTQITSKANRSNPKPGGPCHPLAAGAHPPAIAVNFRGREEGSRVELGGDIATSLRTGDGGSSKPHALIGYQVRRLTPVECARLQGFPDLYCHIEYGRPRKIEPDEAAYLLLHGLRCWQHGDQWMTAIAADGNMYRAYGNSWPVPVVRWIGERMDKALKQKKTERVA